jgi:hypothetical protein
LLQRLASGFLGGYDEKLDLPQAELVISLLGTNVKDLLDSGQNRLGDEWGAVGSFFDAPSKHTVERFGIEASPTQLILDRFGSNHVMHLRSETQSVH